MPKLGAAKRNENSAATHSPTAIPSARKSFLFLARTVIERATIPCAPMHTDAAQPLVPDATRFRMLPEPARERKATRNKAYINEVTAKLFTSDSLLDRFCRALGARRAVRFKEVLEAVEFFAVARRRVKSTTVVDMCAGHGLVGILFGLYERRVERVVLVEPKPPGNRPKVLAAAYETAPWLEGRIEFVDRKIEHATDPLIRDHAGAGLVAVHACGLLTDRAIELGIQLGGPMALLPCCRPHARSPAPFGLAQALGADAAFDVDRTYRLEAAGWTVRWSDIPAAITPMNRVLLAWPRPESGEKTT